MHNFLTLSVKTKGILALVALVLLGGGGWLLIDRGGLTVVPTGSKGIDVNGATTTPEYTVNFLGNETVPAPSLDRKVPESIPGFDESAYAVFVENYTNVVARLKDNPESAGDWLQLGVLRQMMADYAGAAEAWVYVTKRAPNDATAYSNLANLYTAYIKDYAKAETYYKQAIALSATIGTYYLNLHDIYRHHLKDSTKAIAILKEGITNVPQEIALYVTLARYYKELGMTSEAKAEYDAAIAASADANIKAELAAEKSSL